MSNRIKDKCCEGIFRLKMNVINSNISRCNTNHPLSIAQMSKYYSGCINMWEMIASMDYMIAHKHEIELFDANVGKFAEDFHQSAAFDPNGSLYVVQSIGAVWHVWTIYNVRYSRSNSDR